MPSSSTIGSQRIDWPAGWDRTAPTDRTQTNRFEASLQQSIADIEDELEHVGVATWRLSTAAAHQQRRPNYPHSDASPDDPGAVVRWSMDGEQYAVACDSYTELRDNVRTLYLHIRQKRILDERPVKTANSEFATVRLPSADETDVPSDEYPDHVILGIPPDADPSTVRDAFRRMVKTAHPDNGGSEAEFRRVCEAKESMLE